MLFNKVNTTICCNLIILLFKNFMWSFTCIITSTLLYNELSTYIAVAAYAYREQKWNLNLYVVTWIWSEWLIWSEAFLLELLTD